MPEIPSRQERIRRMTEGKKRLTFTLSFVCENAAFCEDDGEPTSDSVGREVDAILGRMRRVGTEGFGVVPGDSGSVLDSNGNTVGRWSLAAV